MRHPLRGALFAGLAAATLIAAVSAPLAAAEPDGELPFRAFAPGVMRGEAAAAPTTAPTPKPVPYAGPVESLHLASARLGAGSPVEVRDTHFIGGEEFFEDPSAPAYIAWYERFGHPGFAGNNSVFAAHIDYVGYGKGPFGYLTSASAGDALYVTMDNGVEYAYTVRSVEIVHLDTLDMDSVVFPALGAGVERITLISCGGTFVPRPGGGGEYDSRVILVAERVAG